ncbi:unnamed protein product [Rotaria sp. Silwood2]|nr:unnamed protein product [Rotaria sp. Silwood2]CAF3090843.1 unnamed protein product [Rotaria sp. Silwood2]CAF3337089.1 unnamed protein product [Rotaria sp. Silwood2]CAF3426733.1 unnamed protein product [Rotaria sp. Silwood2]CAF4306336.1 unnamed protein product [Rotaria sp. Silwood2]
MDLSNEYPQGKEFIWWPFTSCTSSLNIINKYIDQNVARTMFNIVCHSTKDISQYSSYKEEEVLCYLARQFIVKSCLHAKNQLYIIYIEEIQLE